MPADLWTDAVRMAGCGLAVAAAAAPVGLAAWAWSRRAGTPLLPKPRPWRVPWTGLEVVLGFVALNAIPPVALAVVTQSEFYRSVYGPNFPATATPPPFEATAGAAGSPAALAARDQHIELSVVRSLWAGVLALPVQIGLLVLVRNIAFPGWRPAANPRAIPARVALAVLVWALLTPAVLAIHAAVNLAFTALDLRLEDHPLSKLSAARPAVDHVLFFLQAGVAAPLVEEILFRGLLLGWLVGGQSFVDPLLGLVPRSRHAPARRVWIVLSVAVLLAVLLGEFRPGPVAFAALLAAGWGVLRLAVRRKRRTHGAVYASAALFAVVHSSVWPTPIPLFALGLGLGWVAVRTRGVLAPALVHGLFNAVSVLFVLRGG